jgi:YD repeat-containing protein
LDDGVGSFDRVNLAAVIDQGSRPDRLITITYPPAQSGGSSTTSTFTYDSRGRRTSATDQNGKTTSYDTADRLTTVTDAAGNVTFSSVQGSSRLPKQSYWRSYCLFL